MFTVKVNGRAVLTTEDRYTAESRADAESTTRPDARVSVVEKVAA